MVSNKVKSSKSNTTSNSKYKGIITAKIINKNGKVIKTIKKHNKGQEFLFEQLTKCLIGSNVRSNMPNYLDAGYLTGDSSKESEQFKSRLINPVALTGRYVKKFNNAYWAAVFDAFISESNILDETKELGLSAFVLQPTKNAISTEILAVSKLEGNESIELEQGQSLLIEWKMIVSDIEDL